LSIPLPGTHKVASQERAAFTLAKLAMDGRLVAMRRLFRGRSVLPQCAREYNTAQHRSGTLMRYFFSAPGPEPALSLGVIEPTSAAASVTSGGTALGCDSRLRRAASGTINVTAITVATDHHQSVTTHTLVHPGTGVHRHTGPMRAGV